MYPWYFLCSLGILGDYDPSIPTIYGLYRAYTGISHRGTLVGVHPTIPWHLAPRKEGPGRPPKMWFSLRWPAKCHPWARRFATARQEPTGRVETFVFWPVMIFFVFFFVGPPKKKILLDIAGIMKLPLQILSLSALHQTSCIVLGLVIWYAGDFRLWRALIPDRWRTRTTF